MNSMNDMMVQAHREDLMRDAEAHRLAKQAATSKKSNAVLATLGRQMVKIGEHLVTEHVPQRKLQPES